MPRRHVRAGRRLLGVADRPADGEGGKDLDQRVTDPDLGIVAVDVAEDPGIGNDAFLVEDDDVVTRPDFVGVRAIRFLGVVD